MSNKNLDKKMTQVIMKTDTTEHWELCENKYIPNINTIIVYKDEGKMPRIKISDGIHLLGDLPFINNFSSEQDKPHPIVDGDLLEFR